MKKKSIWRVIIAGLLLGGVGNAARQTLGEHDPVAVITYVVLDVLITGIAVYLIVSYFRASN